jgi:DNA-binding Lrp family transcriptional regulator
VETIATRLDIRTIKKLAAQGWSIAEIADKYGVTRQAVYARLKKEEEKKHGTGEGGTAYGLQKVKYLGSGDNRIVDPKTGLVVDAHGTTGQVIGRMGDERVTAFVTYHMECLAMRQGVDKKNPQDLYDRFMRYLAYCQEHGVIPGAANARLAIGVSSRDILNWERGNTGTPEHKQFAEDFKAVLASVNEQAAADGILNPVLSIFWSKAYYGLTDQPKVEVEVVNPLGEKQSGAQIAQKYADILPEDT